MGTGGRASTWPAKGSQTRRTVQGRTPCGKQCASTERGGAGRARPGATDTGGVAAGGGQGEGTEAGRDGGALRAAVTTRSRGRLAGVRAALGSGRGRVGDGRGSEGTDAGRGRRGWGGWWQEGWIIVKRRSGRGAGSRRMMGARRGGCAGGGQASDGPQLGQEGQRRSRLWRRAAVGSVGRRVRGEGREGRGTRRAPACLPASQEPEASGPSAGPSPCLKPGWLLRAACRVQAAALPH